MKIQPFTMLRNLSMRATTATMLTLLLMVALPVTAALAVSAGPTLAGTGSDDSAVGTVAWGSPGNITADDDSYAVTGSLGNNVITHYLKGSGFAFNIPANATINGIQVTIGRYATHTDADNEVRDSTVSLVKGGAVTGDNKATTAQWPTSEAPASYGSTSDLWGTTWTPADINDSNFGVALSAVNFHLTGQPSSNTASVDYISVTVTYENGTTTSVDCTSPVAYGSDTTCTATVTRDTGTETPDGTVTWTTDGSGSFSGGGACTLSGSGASTSCSVTYTPSAVGTGSHLITATYGGNSSFDGSSGNQTVTVDKATATVTLGDLSQTYDGSPKSASATTNPSGLTVDLTYDSSPTAPTNAGSYAVVGTVNDPNYSGSNSGTLVVDKANAVISVTAYDVTYDGSAHTATGTATGVNSEDLSGDLDLSGTTHTNAGTYNGDAWSFAASTNYNSDSGTVDDNIGKANAVVSVTAYDVTYDGSAHTATGTATGVNSEDLSGDLDLSGTMHTNAGAYNGDAWSFAASTNYNSDSGTVDDNIGKANAVISVTAYDVTYDGFAHIAAGTATGVNSEDLSSDLDLSGTMHTNAGAYNGDTWSFTASTNYNSDSGTVDDNIGKATPALSVTNSPVIYNGSAQAASVSAGAVSGTPGNIQYDGSSTVPMDAGTYVVTADFTSSDPNYDNLTGALAGDFVINKAALTVTAENKAKQTTAPDPAFTFFYTGFVGSDGEGDIDVPPTCSSAGDHSVAGSYPITCSGGLDDNYTFSYVNGTLTVTAANNAPIITEGASIDVNMSVNGTPTPFDLTLHATDADFDTLSWSISSPASHGSAAASGTGTSKVIGYTPTTDYSGTDSFVVRVSDGFDSDTITVNVTITPLTAATFADVPTSYWAWQYVESIYAAGITSGCATSPLRYCPEDNVTRAQMAVFLERGIHGSGFTPSAVTLTFDDTAGNFAQYWIEALKSDGITSGCGPSLYCPDASTTRAEMAVFLLRAKHGAGYVPPAASGTLFSDVPTSYWAAKWIEQLATEGITSGCGPNLYCPDATVTRGQMAVFIQRVFNLPLP